MNKKRPKTNRNLEQSGYDSSNNVNDPISEINNEQISPVEVLDQDQKKAVKKNPWLCEDMEWGLYLA